MGGVYWNYFVPHQDDVSAALQRLRSETFRAGKYSYSRDMPSLEELDELPELADEEPLDKPQTIEELLEQEEESGTNSIIDITHIAHSPEFGAVTPMPPEIVRELFGTEKPTHEMVEAKRYDLDLVEHSLVCEKWQGVYFTVYRNGRPDEVFFAGSSGDH
jgi:hypothetical protein